MAYIADSVAIKHAAQSVIKEAQATLKKVATKKEIDMFEQLRALRENRIAGALFSAVSKPTVDVDALQKENASLLKTFDSLYSDNKKLQDDLKTATDAIEKKDDEIAKLKKNQDDVKTNNAFLFGQAEMLSDLVRSGRLYIEPGGHHLVESLSDVVKGDRPLTSFAGIKSGLLSYAPRVNQPENGLKL